jgi:hypothetical protein
MRCHLLSKYTSSTALGAQTQTKRFLKSFALQNFLKTSYGSFDW